jgi:hypothetical protein
MAEPIEKRIKLKPIPDNLYKILKKPQISTILHAEAMGWNLWFVRRRLFTTVVPVMRDEWKVETAVIEEDGNFNTRHGLNFRPDP